MNVCPGESGTFDVGNQIRLLAVFTDVDGALIDPTTVDVSIKKPDRSIVTATATRLSLGNYYYDVVLDQVGYWYYRFVGSGLVVAAADSSFTVDNSPILA